MARKRIKKAYLYGPIEFTSDPDLSWRYIVEELLKPLGIESINPVKVSYLVGKTIEDNARYARMLKRERKWRKFDKFMARIWGQNQKGVDPADVLICWVSNLKELRNLNASGGSYRELLRGEQGGKLLFLICEVGLQYANSHLLDIIRSNGAIFKNVSGLVKCLRH